VNGNQKLVSMKESNQRISGIRKMLSFNHLGNLGRLGNQMFQYASLKGIAKRREYEFVVPPRQVFGNIDENVRSSDACLYDCFEIQELQYALSEYPRLTESTFGFDENIYYNCPDSVDLLGYFQCEKYFEHIEDEIRKDFTFKEDITEVSKEIFFQLFGEQVRAPRGRRGRWRHRRTPKVISLHVRRGDYVVNPNHPTQSLEYYQQALSHFDENLPVIIFSDDPQWCNEQELFKPDRFFISEGGDTRVDLCLMSLCSYHIIANSSYSWWGSYLANSEKTVAPSDWFGDELKKTKNTSELYRKNWIVI